MIEKLKIQPKPQRSFRVEDGLWDAAMEKARGENLMLSQVIRRFLVAYVSEPEKKPRKRRVKADVDG